jgi:hypothetical protein
VLLQVPVAAPLQPSVPGVQMALHVPAVTGPLTHLPVLSQLLGVVPLQLESPGLQAPQAPLDSHAGVAAIWVQSVHVPPVLPHKASADPATHA